MPAFRVWSIAAAILFALQLPVATHSQAASRVDILAKHRAVPLAKFKAKRAVKFGAVRRARIRRRGGLLGIPLVAGIYVPPGTVLPPYYYFPRPYARWNFYPNTGWQQRTRLWSSHLKPGRTRLGDDFYKPVPGIKSRLRPSKTVTRNQWLSPTNWSKPTPW